MLLLVVLSQSKRPLAKAPSATGSGRVYPLGHPKGLGHGQDRVRHFECFNIVRVIERESLANKSKAEIAAGLTTHCNRLNDYRQNICAAIVPGRITEALELLEQKRRPDFVCEVLGYSRWFGNSRFVSEATCVQVVDEVRQLPDPRSGKFLFKRGKRGPFEGVGGDGREAVADEVSRWRKKRDSVVPAAEEFRGGKFADKWPLKRRDASDREADGGPFGPKQPMDDARPVRKLKPFDIRKIKADEGTIERPPLVGKKKRPALLEVIRRDGKRQADEEDTARALAVRKVTVCKDLDEEERTACLALSRLVSRGMRPELKAGMSSLDVCQKLHEQNIIKLTNPKGRSREQSI